MLVVNEEKAKILSEFISKDVKRSGGPDYENNIRTKFLGYNLIFSFPTCPVENVDDRFLAFPAYVTEVTDDFNINYNPVEVYGRMDAIPVYQRTTRTIGFDLKIPSNGLEQSREIARKLNVLVKNVYPSYERSGNVNIISSPPLVRVSFSNLIFDSKTGSSVLGYFANNLQIKHDIGSGVFSRLNGYETYPKAYDMTFSINVLHEYTPGFYLENNVIQNPVAILGGR